MDWLYGIFGVCSSRGSKPPPPAADIEKDSSAYKGPCAQDDDLADDLMAPGRLYNLCKAKEAPPIDLVQQLISDPTRKSERISYKSPKDNDFKQTPLHAASGNGHEAVVRVLLDAGADFKARDKEKCTPLHDAAVGGFDVVVKMLIAAQADVNALSADKETPLHKAALYGSLPVVKTLVEAKVDVNAKANGPRTALQDAKHNGFLHVVQYLKQNAALE